MSALKSTILSVMKETMKAGAKDKLAVIRLIQAAMKQKEVDERIELTDDQILGLLDKMIRQRRDSIQQYTAAQRLDLAEKEAFEITVIQAFMPAQLGDAEIQAIVGSAITEAGAQSIKDMAKVMSLVKPQLQGRADMGQVSALIKDRLSVQ